VLSDAESTLCQPRESRGQRLLTLACAPAGKRAVTVRVEDSPSHTALFHGHTLVSTKPIRYTAAHRKTILKCHALQPRLTARLEGVATYILMVRLTVKQDHIDDFIKASIAGATGSGLQEPGCRRFDIIQDETNPRLFAFTKVYNDEAAFEHHKTTPHFARWHAAVKNMLDGDGEGLVRG
jgi:autoinducer 2-degrading protein